MARTCILVGLALAGLALTAPAAYADGAVNGRISFTSFRDGKLGDIWTMYPDGSDLRRLTGEAPEEPPVYDAQSDWSPDGRWLAFRRGPNASTSLAVWKMDADGEQEQLLARGDAAFPRQNATQPAWAPDGRSILFRANRPPYADTDVWEMAPDGSAQRLVAHLAGEQFYPSYSPDKSRIAYTSPVTGDRAIYTVAPDGSDQRLVFDALGADDSAPNWSPDGRLIAFESDMDGDGEIYVIAADGSGLRQLTANHIHDEGPSWSPDGRRIVFTSGPGNLEGDIHIMDADGGNRRQITDSPGRDESPDWQPLRHEGELVACGDVVMAGPGAYSVKAGGAGLACEQARAIAADWPAAGQHPFRGFRCESEPAGSDALLVQCRHAGDPGTGEGNERALVWLLRQR